MATKVKNLNGTSDNTCKCGSWLAHWEKFSGKQRGLCSKTTCSAKATVGAHVQKDDSTDKAWYIVPLCDACNKGEKSFSVDQPLVSANVSETCGKGK